MKLTLNTGDYRTELSIEILETGNYKIMRDYLSVELTKAELEAVFMMGNILWTKANEIEEANTLPDHTPPDPNPTNLYGDDEEIPF